MRTSKSAVNPIEAGVRRRARRGSIERAILSTIALGGILTVAAAAPKVFAILSKDQLENLMPKDPAQRLRETFSRLKKKGLISFEGAEKRPILTKKGEDRARRIRFEEFSIPIPRRWDGRWRIVIFDIPHVRKKTRDQVRGILKRLGFYRLQNSVWVHPHDCEAIIALIKLDVHLRSEIRYIVADAIEFDRELRAHFGFIKK